MFCHSSSNTRNSKKCSEICFLLTILRALYAFVRGVYDSFHGIGTIFYIDKEINERTKSRLSPTNTTTPIRRRQSEDSPRESTPVRSLKKHEESKVLSRTWKCAMLNGAIFLVSVWLFQYIMGPSIRFLLVKVCGLDSAEYLWPMVFSFMQFVFHTIWVVPLLLLSRVINALWFQDIADSAFRHSRGRPMTMQSISQVLADSVFSIVIQILFLIQATIVRYIPLPILAEVLTYLHMCLLYALYGFEYKWFNMGWELHKRLMYIEMYWPYFFGFGLPLTIVTELTDSWIISGCVFSTLFPFFIVSSNEANPVTVNIFPLRFFSVVIALSNFILTKTVGGKAKTAPAPRAQRATSVDSQRSTSSRSSRLTEPRNTRSSSSSVSHHKR